MPDFFDAKSERTEAIMIRRNRGSKDYPALMFIQTEKREELLFRLTEAQVRDIIASLEKTLPK